jgi:hypothetical protein
MKIDKVFMQGIVRIKSYENAIDKWYTVEETFSLSRLNSRSVITKFNIPTNDVFEINDFSAENRYYDPINKVIRYNPYVDIFLSNQSSITKFFKTVDEMKDFLKIFDNEKTIDIL